MIRFINKSSIDIDVKIRNLLSKYSKKDTNNSN